MVAYYIEKLDPAGSSALCLRNCVRSSSKRSALGAEFLVSTSSIWREPELFALSLFRWELPERELFRRSKDDPQTGGETSSEESVIVVLLISSNAHSA